jgi:hypothetical protein
LSRRDLFAVRTGVLKFRGFILKTSGIPFTPAVPLTDADFEAKFEQKGVDMRIGLDMAILHNHEPMRVGQGKTLIAESGQRPANLL